MEFSRQYYAHLLIIQVSSQAVKTSSRLISGHHRSDCSVKALWTHGSCWSMDHSTVLAHRSCLIICQPNKWVNDWGWYMERKKGGLGVFSFSFGSISSSLLWLLRIPGEIPRLWWPRKFSFFLRGVVNQYSKVPFVVKFNLFIFSMIQLEMTKHMLGASLVAQMVQKLPAMQETWVWSLGQEDPL